MTLLSFAGSPHGGSYKLLPEWRSQPRIRPVLIIDHSIVGSAIGAWWYFRDRSGLESHFIIRGRRSGSADGHIWQLMDTDRQADANLQANDKAISIETEDDGDPDTQPWTTAQLQSLIWLHDKLAKIHPTIARREATDCDGPGLAYHTKLGAPSCWTPIAKTCPGRPARVRQWQQILLPAFLHPEEDDFMALFNNVNEFKAAVRSVVREEVGKAYEALARGEINNRIDESSTHFQDSHRGLHRQVSSVYEALARGEINNQIDPTSQHYKDSHRALYELLVAVAAATGTQPPGPPPPEPPPPPTLQ
jgi:hypothetical protein